VCKKKLHSFIHLTNINIYELYYVTDGCPRWLRGKPACQCRRCGFDPWVREIPLEKEMATHSSILAGKILWTEKPGGLQLTGLQRVGCD